MSTLQRKKQAIENAERSRAMDRIRALDWSGLSRVIAAYSGEQVPRSFRYGAVWAYGHFRNQPGELAIGHLDANAHRDAVDLVKSTHPDRRNALPHPTLSAFQLDLLQSDVLLEQAKAVAKRYGVRLTICQGNNPRADAVGRLFLQLSEKGLGFLSWAFAAIRHGLSS